MIQLHRGVALAVLATMPAESIDSIVTDPPYGLSREPDAAEVLRHWLSGDDYEHGGGGFMGKSWDSFVPGPAVWKECLRVLKPGGHLVCFAGSRTVDLMGMAIRLGGFEIRDQLQWLYGSGFPKSLSVHKATVKAVESRYGSARCTCLDGGAGVLVGDDAGRRGGDEDRPERDGGVPPTEGAGGSDLPIHQGSDDDSVRELRHADGEEVQGPAPLPAAVLLDGVRGSGAEAAGHGHASVRAGMEEPSSGDPQAGPRVPVVWSQAQEVDRTACPPSGAVPVRGDEPLGELGGAVRDVSPQDRGDHDAGVGVDPGRSEPRRTILDDHGGGRAAMAAVCSWCGLPDPAWLMSLEPLGTALKPAHEPIILARKPLSVDGRKATVADNVLAHGTGALNIDATRIGTEARYNPPAANVAGGNALMMGVYGMPQNVDGRWPANVVLGHHEDCVQVGTAPDTFGGGASMSKTGDATVEFGGGYQSGDGFVGREVEVPIFDCHPDCAAGMLDSQTGTLKSGARKAGTYTTRAEGGVYAPWEPKPLPPLSGDSGGASRFFYCAKTAKSERNAGLPEGMKNDHPTVKPVALMEWLVRMVTPPGGTVLDPFCGSGTTMVAAERLGFDGIGIDRDDDDKYLAIARHRVRHASELEYEAGQSPPPAPSPVPTDDSGVLDLFPEAHREGRRGVCHDIGSRPLRGL